MFIFPYHCLNLKRPSAVDYARLESQHGCETNSTNQNVVCVSLNKQLRVPDNASNNDGMLRFQTITTLNVTH